MPTRSHSHKLHLRLAAAVVGAAALLIALLQAAMQPAAASTIGYTVSRAPISFGRQVAVNPATDIVYVAFDGDLQAIDGATNTVSGTISLPATADVVEGMAVDPATDTLYVAMRDTETGVYAVAVISGATNAVTSTIDDPANAYGIAVDPATDTIYTAGIVVSVIDGATDTITGTVRVGANQIAVDPATDTIFAGGGNSVSVIDGGTNAVAASISLGIVRPTGIAVDPDTNTVYVADNEHGAVIVIDGATDTVTTTIVTTSVDVASVAVNPAADTIYATADNGFAGMTAVIDGATNTVTDTLPRGSFDIAADPATGAAYVPGYGGQHPQLWIITPSATNELSPIITGAQAAVFGVGVPADYTDFASATPAATFTETGPLPSGVRLNPDGTFTGTPASGSAGSYPITITASNGVAPDDSLSFTVTVDQPPAITSASSATFTVGTAGSFNVLATGVPEPTLTESGGLPGGVTFNADGTLAGTPAAGTGGSYLIQFTAQNSFSEVSQPFTLLVDQPPSITSAGRAAFTAGSHNSFTLRTSGFPAARLREHGQLPTGVRFVAERDGRAKLVGVPARSTRGHSYVITIIARNGVGQPALQTFTLRIRRH